MGALINLSGRRFGRLTVLYRVGTKQGSPLWLCKCDCGNTKEVIMRSLTTGNTKSCGCIHKQKLAKRNTMSAKHGGADKERLYNIWHGMRQRCNDSNHKDYPRYGGRGITICPEWNDYAVFRAWALANGYADDLTIDRKEVNGNYCPENCQWADAKTQANNRRTENVRRNADGTFKRAN